MSGIRRLVDYPWVLVRVRCEVCKRAGAYRLARLAVKFGAEILLDDLIVRLSSDCAWRDDPRGSWVLAGFDPQWPNLNVAVAEFDLNCIF